MYKVVTVLMLAYLLFTGQFIWFWTFSGALIVWEILKLDERMYKKRTKKRQWQ